jgi:NAD(P)-dependent dehydrogenase (short-subunit alcohol dehydrogenase family)
VRAIKAVQHYGDGMPSVLITGAGRGIGRASAIRLAERGWEVYAGIRSEADGESLADAGRGHLHPVQLDVTSSADVAALDDRLPATLDAVVNNAGIVVGGAIESIDLTELRRQLEVNVVGQVAVTQAVLPRLRASKGRIVFLSSISGRVASPMLGAYSASKFAIEAIADSLRMELRPWRISVVLVEPGQIDTDIWRNAGSTLDETVAATAPAQRDLYAGHIAGLRRAIPLAQRMASEPEGVAATIERALTARRPRSRYLTGAGARLQGPVTARVPTPVRDAVLRTMTGVPRRPPRN